LAVAVEVAHGQRLGRVRREGVLIRRDREVRRTAECAAERERGEVRQQRKAAGLEIGGKNIGLAVAGEVRGDRRKRRALDDEILTGIEIAVARALQDGKKTAGQRYRQV